MRNYSTIGSFITTLIVAVLALSPSFAQVPNHAAALKDLNRQLLEASGAGGPQSYAGADTANLGQLLANRRSALSALIAENPSEALTLAFPPSLLERLAAKYPRHAALLESRGNWQGISESLIADDESLEDGREFHFLKFGGTTIELHFAGRKPAGLSSGSILNVGGVRVGNVLAVQDGEVMAASTAKAAGACGPTGGQRVVVILVRLPGFSLPSTVNAELMKGILRGNTYSTNTNNPNWSVGDFWQENSDGQTWVDDVKVVGPYTLSSNYNSDTNNDGLYDCQYTDMRLHAIAAADGEVNFNDYDRVLIVFPKNTRTNANGTIGGCNWAGLGSLGCWSNSSNDGNFTASIAWLRSDQTSSRSLGVRLGTHELGHNFGLLHSNSRDFGNDALGPLGVQGTIAEYGDRFSTMGTWNFGFYTSQHAADQLGWLETGSNVRVVESNGSYTIQNYEARPAGVKALKIRRGTGNNAWLWAELRQNTGIYDSQIIAQAHSGALLHYQDSYTGQSSHLADFTATSSFFDPALAAGQSWTDPYSDLSISVDSVSPSAMTMTVTYGNSGGCLEANPAISLNPSSQTTFAGVAANFSVSVTNQDGSGCGPASFNLTPTVPQGWTATANPPSVSLAPGQSANATVSVTPSGASQPASYAMSLLAAHENATNSASAAATMHIEPTVNDLAVTSVTAPAAATQGTLANVSVALQNVGNVAVSDDISVTLHDQTDNLSIGSQIIAGLAPGVSQTLTFTWNTTAATAGVSHSLQARQMRADGNTGNDTGIASVLVNQPLALTGLAPSAIPMGASTPVTITGTGFQSGAALQFWNGSGPQPSASNVVVVNSTTITASVQVGDDNSTQDRNWNVRVTNPGGATATYAGVLTVLGDEPPNAAPQVSITSPANNAPYTLGDTLTVSGSASDTEDGNVTSSLVWTSSLAGTIGTGGAFTWTPGALGTHVITASVTDSQGQAASRSVSVTISADNPPSVSITSPVTGTSITLGSSVALAAAANDDEDGGLSQLISWSSSLTGPIATGGSANWTPSTAGSHVITASVIDSAGQIATAAVTVTVSVDSAPTISISSPSGQGSFPAGAAISLVASAGDAEDGVISHLITWSSNLAGSIGSGSSISWTPAVSGFHVVTASVTDSAGHTSTANRTVTVNPNSPPVITVSSPSGQPVVAPGGSVALAASATDSENGNVSHLITWSSSLQGQIGSGASLTWTPTALGLHLIVASVSDSLGATATATARITVGTLNSAPSVVITSPAQGASVSQGVVSVITPSSSGAGNRGVTSAVSTSSGNEVVAPAPVALLAGTAFDAEDGDLSAALTWSSDIDGLLGTGSTVNAALTAGVHTLSATVADSSGVSASASVVVTVEPGIEVTVSAYTYRGRHRMNIKWTNATGTNVEIHRWGTSSADMVTRNDGQHLDGTNRKGSGLYHYQVCEIGRLKCSAVAQASF